MNADDDQRNAAVVQQTLLTDLRENYQKRRDEVQTLRERAIKLLEFIVSVATFLLAVLAFLVVDTNAFTFADVRGHVTVFTVTSFTAVFCATVLLLHLQLSKRAPLLDHRYFLNTPIGMQDAEFFRELSKHYVEINESTKRILDEMAAGTSIALIFLVLGVLFALLEGLATIFGGWLARPSFQLGLAALTFMGAARYLHLRTMYKYLRGANLVRHELSVRRGQWTDTDETVNPTLKFDLQRRNEIQIENLDGREHALVLEDEAGQVVSRSRTLEAKWETATIEIDDTLLGRVASYSCAFHSSERGTVTTKPPDRGLLQVLASLYSRLHACVFSQPSPDDREETNPRTPERRN